MMRTVTTLAFTAALVVAVPSTTVGSRGLNNQWEHTTYLDSFVPCGRQADGHCGVWSLTESKWIICSDQNKCRHFPGCDPRGVCQNGQYCAVMKADEHHRGGRGRDRRHDNDHHEDKGRRHGKSRGKGHRKGRSLGADDDEDSSSSSYSDDTTGDSSESDSSSSSSDSSSSSSSSDDKYSGPWESEQQSWQADWGYWTHPYSRGRYQCDSQRQYTYCQPCTATCYNNEVEVWGKCQQRWKYAGQY